MKKILLFSFFLLLATSVAAQDIPQHISYTRIYDFLDELANEGLIELNSAIKPYSREFISKKLLEAQDKKDELNIRQRKETAFFLNEYALEQDKLPEDFPRSWKTDCLQVGLIQPAAHYRDDNFRARITPLLGMHIWHNNKGNITKRWFGAEFQGMIGKNLSVYGSLRDNSMTKIDGDMLSKSSYLNDQPGYQYKEATYGGDYSDSRGGIKYAWKTGSVGLVKDNIVWGDNYHGSNIISGRAPSFPMLTLNLKPAKWFELNYFHGWLVSNIKDSSYYYIGQDDKKEYRMANKFIAANMFTFTPLRNLNLSVGNSIIYGERSPHPAYFIPIAFYKSLDHTLTKGLGTENQNSQVFFNISSRNIKHLHVFTSVYADEIKFSRFKPDEKQNNPISYKIGANLTNFPLENLSFTGEFTHTNIINYKHKIPVLSWTSNDYNLGHYMGDNSRELYLVLGYKPIRGLDLKIWYANAEKGNEYDYLQSNIKQIISQPVMQDIIWKNNAFGLNAVYEVFNNGYAVLNIENSHIQTFEPASAAIVGEKRMTAQEALDYFTPAFLQGKNTTITLGFSFGF
ncbi:MAG: capsule assembly Wzi family protein [Prevotellaceae bacterium]|jgi:hypothetical protein|nr:capsule assembly Wzi family protein [Prevotellaceae bacterium]